MTQLTLFTGLLLTALGLIAYLASGAVSITALIPAFFGLPVTVLGIIGRREEWRKHSMHTALIIILLGFIGTVAGVPKFFSLLAGQEIARPSAVVVQTIMAVTCLIYLIYAIRYFIKARKKESAS